MKKTDFLLLALLPAFALGSCSKDGASDETNYPAGTVPIVFGIEPENTSRAVPVTATTLPATSKFGVYAYRLPGTASDPGNETNAVFDASFINDLEATVVNSTTVTYEATKFWPASQHDRLKFLAYYPYDAPGVTRTVDDAASTSDPYLQLVYEVPTSHASHQDLMVASALPEYKAGVTLTFYHALTRLTFEAKRSSDFPSSDQVVVTGVSITGITNKATLKVNTASASTLAWTGLQGNGTYTGTFTLADATIPHGTASYTPIGAGGDSFMVIPVGTNFDDAEINVTATWNGQTMNPFKAKLKEISDSNNKWEVGQWVNYQFEIKPNGIVFSSIEVNEWGTKTNVPVTFE